MSTLNLNTTALATSNSVRINLYKESSPLTIISSQTFAAPHAERVISFYNLEASQNYRYRWIEIDGSGNTIQQYASQSFTTPSSGSIEIKETEYLQVGITAGLTAGATTATFASWIGWKPIIEYRGFGTLRPIEDYTYNIATGLLTMLIAPFEANGLYSVIFQPKIISDALPATSNLFNFIRYITVDATIDVDDFGKRLIQVDGAGSTVNLTLPLITTVTENKILIIRSGRGSHKAVTIVSSNANAVDFLAGARTKIYMGTQEVIKIYRQNKSGVNTWQVLDPVGNFFTTGQFVSEYGIGFNKLPMLGVASYSSLEYPRLYEYIENLDPSLVVAYDVWFADKRRFSLKNVSNLFRIPDLTDLYERVTTVPGTYQEMMMLDHKHESPIGTLPTILFGRGSNRLKGNYDRVEIGQTDLTSSPINVDGTVMSFNGSEIRPKTYTSLKYVLV